VLFTSLDDELFSKFGVFVSEDEDISDEYGCVYVESSLEVKSDIA
jgi:hypothetical protein